MKKAPVSTVGGEPVAGAHWWTKQPACQVSRTRVHEVEGAKRRADCGHEKAVRKRGRFGFYRSGLPASCKAAPASGGSASYGGDAMPRWMPPWRWRCYSEGSPPGASSFLGGVLPPPKPWGIGHDKRSRLARETPRNGHASLSTARPFLGGRARRPGRRARP